MLTSLDTYTGADRLNYVCLAMEAAGLVCLADWPMISSGFSSVLSVLPEPAQLAVRNIRRASPFPDTRAALDFDVRAYKNLKRVGDDGSLLRDPIEFEIDTTKTDLPFHRVRQVASAKLAAAQAELFANLPHKVRAAYGHDVNRGFRIDASKKLDDEADASIGQRFQASLPALNALFPEIPQHPVHRVPRKLACVTWAELLAEAERFDAIDEAAGRQPPGLGGWRRRLQDEHGDRIQLLEPRSEGCAPSQSIDLEGVQHLVGLTGAGKTTILKLLAGLFAARKARVTFLFPSVMVATNFVEEMALYDVKIALLMGRSDTSVESHARNFAASLAEVNGGFGRSRPAAANFSTICALGGAVDGAATGFPHLSPPCSELLQATGDRERKTICPAASVCGRQTTERGLATSDLWAGHVLSLDRELAPTFSSDRRYVFEQIAESMDLVIMDECDGVQKDLDRRGTVALNFVGRSDNLGGVLHAALDGRALAGRNAFLGTGELGEVPAISRRLIDASLRLTAILAEMVESRGGAPRFRKVAGSLRGQMQTSRTILSELFDFSDTDDAARWRAVQSLWDGVNKTVVFSKKGSDDIDESALNPVDIGKAIGWEPQRVQSWTDRVIPLVQDWQAERSETALQEVATALAELPRYAPDSRLTPADVADLVCLLLGVTQVILRYIGLAPFLRLLQAREQMTMDAVGAGASQTLRTAVSEALVGRLAGVRFDLQGSGDIHLDYIAIRGAPRTLPDRLASGELSRAGIGPAVLLTSATSFIEPAPSHHVSQGPHRLLRPRDVEMTGDDSRYAFAPISDPSQAGIKLRFSGGSRTVQGRMRILQRMVDGIISGGSYQYGLARSIEEHDVVDGIRRKAAFIVNSHQQSRDLFDYIRNQYPGLAPRVRAVCDESGGGMPAGAVTSARVESLNDDPGWDLLIFPMLAIGRGVNLAFPRGPRARHAILGTLYFLTRPHPRGDSLDLLEGLIGAGSEAFDRQVFANLDEARDAFAVARSALRHQVNDLLGSPLISAFLPPTLAEPFVADQSVPILQTIGRALRGGRPAQVVFVDAAWAPKSATGQADTAQSSMLVRMEQMLRELVQHPHEGRREVYKALYAPFLTPLASIDGLIR